jgi:hypothetical protein
MRLRNFETSQPSGAFPPMLKVCWSEPAYRQCLFLDLDDMPAKVRSGRSTAGGIARAAACFGTS